MNLSDQPNEIWNRQMGTAIEFIAGGGRTFSAKDIADFEEWEGLEDVIENALQHQCRNGTIMRLNGSYDDEDSYPRYLCLETARRWWVNFTLRLVDTDVDYVTSAQLAKSMSLSLDKGRRWHTPANGLLDVGKEWAIVADGCLPYTYIFPLVTLIRGNTALRGVFLKPYESRPDRPWNRYAAYADQLNVHVNRFQGRSWTSYWRRYTVASSSDQLSTGGGLYRKCSWTSYSIQSAVDEVMSSLTDREAQVIRLRFGLRDAKKCTLEEVGQEFGVTRERIRQIQKKALRKLRHPTRSRVLRLGFTSEFIRSGGSLLLFESDWTAHHSLLDEVLRIEMERLPELGVRVLTKIDLSGFREYLHGDDGHKLDDRELAGFLPFLSKADAERLRKPIKKLKEDVVARWTRPRMLLEALRSLGRAAHFAEIAERCNEMFPNRENAIRNWHSALSQPSAEELGIVWIGRKGMYGLQEHGYSRPTKDLFDSAADIVERVYANTGQPVPDSVVILEMGKVRREAHPNSIIMALGFSERLKSAGGGRYIPIGAGIGGSDKSPTLSYDMSAAFEAFSSDEKDE